MRLVQSLALALALLALPGLLAGCRSRGGADPEQQLVLHREFALRYFDQGDLLRAEQQAAKGLAIDPEDRTLLLMAGHIRLRRDTGKDVLVAEKIFRSLQESGDYRAHLGLAEALERKGVLYREASQAVARGEREPDGGKPRDLRAGELAEESAASLRESIACYEKTLERKPGEFQAINGLQRVHALEGDYAESLRWSESLLEQSSVEIAFWRTQIARPDLASREEDRLRALLESSGKLLYETRLQASTLLVRLGRAEEALVHLDEALDLAPASPDVHSRRGQLRHELGRYGEAAADLKDFLRLSTLEYEHPDVQRAYDLLSDCERRLELEDKARTVGRAGPR